MRAEVLRSYVQDLLEEMTGKSPLTRDKDGDFPVRFRGALYYVRLVGDEDPVVQVFSIAVAAPTAGPELYEHLNDINTRVRFARVMFVRDQVLVESELVAEGVTRHSFVNACRAVGTITDSIGPEIVERFGGRTPFAEEREPVAPDPEARTGLYL